uniref:Uncharacterized protein n=1 Tax=Anguilla anguilla TaxID=7936 RepID=A0A0E9T318_ANGAN
MLGRVGWYITIQPSESQCYSLWCAVLYTK